MESIKDIYDLHDYLSNIYNVGFQSTQIGRARKIIKEMFQDKSTLKILAFTGNTVATGLRGIYIKLIEKGYVDIIVTTGATIDHDVMRSFTEYNIGEFITDDLKLRKTGINRLGNIYIPNRAYEMLEKITIELFHEERSYTPSEIAKIFGKYLYDKGIRSILARCYEKNIPIISPGVVDAAIGLFFYYISKQKKITIDPIPDLKKYLDSILLAEKTGALIVGGGISKHHTIGANIVRGGLDYAIYITSSQEWDGSLSGARSDEAVSWGKIKGKHVDIYGEATIILPLLVGDII